MQQTFVKTATVLVSALKVGLAVLCTLSRLKAWNQTAIVMCPCMDMNLKMHCTTRIIVNDDMAGRKVRVITN